MHRLGQQLTREACYSNRLVRPFRAYLASLGHGTHELSPAELDARVPIRQVLDQLENVVSATGRDDLGLRAAQAMPRGGSGVAHYAALSAVDVGSALQLLIRYAPIVNEAAEFKLVVHGDLACVELRSRVPLHRAASDFQVVMMTRRIADWLGSFARMEAWFHYPEPNIRTAHEEVLPGVPLRFAAPCDAVLFHADGLRRPLETTDPELNAVLVKYAEELLGRVPELQSLAQRVRTAVRALMKQGPVDGTRVAAEIGMSRRSLTRHLEVEHTSYSEVLNDVRREVALQLLELTDLDVQEIADRLGYSLTAAFSRAFRRWEGVSPMQYRKSVRGPTGAARAVEP